MGTVFQADEMSELVNGFFEEAIVEDVGVVDGRRKSGGADNGPSATEGGFAEDKGAHGSVEIVAGNSERQVIEGVPIGSSAFDQPIDDRIGRKLGTGQRDIGRETKVRTDRDAGLQALRDRCGQEADDIGVGSGASNGDDLDRQRPDHC